MKQALWVKEIETPILKPLNQWRDELYGYWMVYTDIGIVDGVKMAVVRCYGTDKDRMYDLYDKFFEASDESAHKVGILFNSKSNWIGGVFLGKSDS